MVEEELPQKAATVHDQEVGHTNAKAQSQQHIREPIERKSWKKIGPSIKALIKMFSQLAVDQEIICGYRLSDIISLLLHHSCRIRPIHTFPLVSFVFFA